ncbi:DUF262 domain-containing protein [Nitratireductor aquimarinus]|nr:DUF262 domain-containing protein [Nitratireductor pacificus]MBN7782444.1 DUF262 domain-containing protein [Nitratireductor pacificus]MBN7791251.1 DUF262 domain-containing protein [Nitratireductor aquimarinus]MBY6100331.1 DUF262 domain-containing protein [Nitratireductor aquimarinus]
MDKETIKRDPKPSVERVENLAQRIVEGDILLPKFQRDFVWNREQILELFDSISKKLSDRKYSSMVIEAEAAFREAYRGPAGCRSSRRVSSQLSS